MDTIGKMLAEERHKRGMDHIDVEHAIGIRALYVKALEEGQYDVLPGEVYVKGFLRNYGNFLGLDGAQLVHLYSESIPIHEHTPVVEHKQHKTAAKPKSNKKLFGVLAAVLTLAVAVGILYGWQQKTAKTPVPATKPNPVAQPQNITTPIPSPSQSGAVVSQNPGLPAKAVVLVVRFTDRCWTSAIADGKTIYEGIPKTGETLTWEADRQIIVNLGNAAAADVSFNGQPQAKMGERGDVVVKIFSASGVTASTVATPPVTPPPASQATPPVTAPGAPGSSPVVPQVKP